MSGNGDKSKNGNVIERFFLEINEEDKQHNPKIKRFEKIEKEDVIKSLTSQHEVKIVLVLHQLEEGSFLIENLNELRDVFQANLGDIIILINEADFLREKLENLLLTVVGAKAFPPPTGFLEVEDSKIEKVEIDAINHKLVPLYIRKFFTSKYKHFLPDPIISIIDDPISGKSEDEKKKEKLLKRELVRDLLNYVKNIKQFGEPITLYLRERYLGESSDGEYEDYEKLEASINFFLDIIGRGLYVFYKLKMEGSKTGNKLFENGTKEKGFKNKILDLSSFWGKLPSGNRVLRDDLRNKLNTKAQNLLKIILSEPESKIKIIEFLLREGFLPLTSHTSTDMILEEMLDTLANCQPGKESEFSDSLSHIVILFEELAGLSDKINKNILFKDFPFICDSLNFTQMASELEKYMKVMYYYPLHKHSIFDIHGFVEILENAHMQYQFLYMTYKNLFGKLKNPVPSQEISLNAYELLNFKQEGNKRDRLGIIDKLKGKEPFKTILNFRKNLIHL